MNGQKTPQKPGKRLRFNRLPHVLCAVLLTQTAAFADTIELRDGKVLRDVKGVAVNGGYYVIFSDGRTRLIRSPNIKQVRLTSPSWKLKKSEMDRSIARETKKWKRKNEALSRELNDARQKLKRERELRRRREISAPKVPERVKYHAGHRRSDFNLALFYSLLFPGAGQFYNQEKSKGVAFMTTGLFLGGLLKSRRASLQTRHTELSRLKTLGLAGVLESPGLPTIHSGGLAYYYLEEDRKLRNINRGQARQIELFTLLYLGLYIYNLFDAYDGSYMRKMRKVRVESTRGINPGSSEVGGVFYNLSPDPAPGVGIISHRKNVRFSWGYSLRI